MIDPVDDIENEKAFTDFGVMAIRVFKGAMTESNSWTEAYFATSAYFHALLTTKPDIQDG